MIESHLCLHKWQYSYPFIHIILSTLEHYLPYRIRSLGTWSKVQLWEHEVWKINTTHIKIIIDQMMLTQMQSRLVVNLMVFPMVGSIYHNFLVHIRWMNGWQHAWSEFQLKMKNWRSKDCELMHTKHFNALNVKRVWHLFTHISLSLSLSCGNKNFVDVHVFVGLHCIATYLSSNLSCTR